MRRRRPHRPATLLVVLVVLHFTRLPSVAGRFRGADHKPIPTVGDDGPVRSVPAGMKTTLGLQKVAPMPTYSGVAYQILLYHAFSASLRRNPKDLHICKLTGLASKMQGVLWSWVLRMVVEGEGRL